MGQVLPLLALRAFAEAGRHGSIKRAADRMGVTSGAVSQQVRQLEARIGVRLLTRTRYGVELTEAGAKVHPALLGAFDQIERSLGALETMSGRETLTVSTVPSFAASWLVPRIGSFTERYPDIDVRVEATSSLVDLRRDRVDIAIRHGLGNYRGLVSSHLMAPVLVPVGSPKLIAAGPPLREPSDCLAFPLLHNSNRTDWRLWLTAFGVRDDPRAERGPAFDDEFLLIRAAESGQGLALVRDIYAWGEIEAGRLMLALDRQWPTEFAYYVVTQPEAKQRQAVALFTRWLETEARASAPALASKAVHDSAPRRK